jgi:hypothetical protein
MTEQQKTVVSGTVQVLIEYRRDPRPGHEDLSGYYVVEREAITGKELQAHGPMDFGKADAYRDYLVNFPRNDPRD